MSITRKDRALVSLPLLLLACAGSSDVVDLGGGSMTQSGAGSGRCADSTTFSGNVFVTQQSDLDELAGCEEITGDLGVMIIPDASLLPLSSLRKVGGAFFLGDSTLALPEVYDELDAEQAQRERARLEALQEQGWLESLEGLEALESVGMLGLHHILAPDLHALGRLESLGQGQAGIGVGILAINGARNLRDLSGLENAASVGSIFLDDNHIESLDGLQLPATMENLWISRHPNLRDLDALAPVTNLIGTLSLDSTGIEDLEGLAGLVGAGEVVLTRNPKLVDVSGLAQLERTPSILIRDNDALTSLPSFENLIHLESLHILDNAALEEVYLYSHFHWTGRFYELTAGDGFGEGHLLPGVRVEIQRNQSLQRITSAGGFTELIYMTIEDNPALTDLDLASIERVDYLSVNRNAILANLSAPALRTVDSLELLDNPMLSAAALASVKTFESVVSGNADEP